MVREETIRGNWNTIRGGIQRRWGQLKGDDLEQFQGDVTALVGEIQRRTGATREAIEEYLSELGSQATSAVGRAGDVARRFANQALSDAPHRLREGLDEGRELLRDRPIQSAAAVLVFGMLAGLAIGLLARSR